MQLPAKGMLANKLLPRCDEAVANTTRSGQNNDTFGGLDCGGIEG